MILSKNTLNYAKVVRKTRIYVCIFTLSFSVITSVLFYSQLNQGVPLL